MAKHSRVKRASRLMPVRACRRMLKFRPRPGKLARVMICFMVYMSLQMRKVPYFILFYAAAQNICFGQHGILRDDKELARDSLNKSWRRSATI